MEALDGLLFHPYGGTVRGKRQRAALAKSNIQSNPAVPREAQAPPTTTAPQKQFTAGNWVAIGLSLVAIATAVGLGLFF